MVSLFFGSFSLGRSVGSLVTDRIYAINGITSTLLFSAGLTVVATLLFLVSAADVIEPHYGVRLVPVPCVCAAAASADTSKSVNFVESHAQSVELQVVVRSTD